MNILVTGAAGFVGRNLIENLKNVRDGKNRTRPKLNIGDIYEFTRDSTQEQLDDYCAKADFVFNLAGVNRPKDPAEFREGNFGFAATLLETLKRRNNTCPVMLSSSLQATLAGRFGTSEYGLSKRDGEDLFFRYAEETGATVYMSYFDWKTKHIGIGKPVELTDDARADTQRIQALYEEMGLEGKHPEKYITH